MPIIKVGAFFLFIENNPAYSFTIYVYVFGGRKF